MKDLGNIEESVDRLGAHVYALNKRIEDGQEVIGTAIGVMMLIGLGLEEKDVIEKKLQVRLTELAMETDLSGPEMAGQACDEILTPRILSDEGMTKRMNAFIQVVGCEEG